MRKFLIIVAAAACLIAAPAAAGELARAVDRVLVARRVHRSPGRRRARRSGAGADHERHRYWRDREVRGGGCKTVTVRETRPDGTRVTRTRSSC